MIICRCSLAKMMVFVFRYRARVMYDAVLLNDRSRESTVDRSATKVRSVLSLRPSVAFDFLFKCILGCSQRNSGWHTFACYVTYHRGRPFLPMWSLYPQTSSRPFTFVNTMMCWPQKVHSSPTDCQLCCLITHLDQDVLFMPATTNGIPMLSLMAHETKARLRGQQWGVPLLLVRCFILKHHYKYVAHPPGQWSCSITFYPLLTIESLLPPRDVSV